MSSLPLADPLRMIITSRRLNFALLRPRPLHRGTLKVQRRRRVHPSLPSSPPPPSSTHPTPLPLPVLSILSILAHLVDYPERSPPPAIHAHP